jgi:hypothetical protein
MRMEGFRCARLHETCTGCGYNRLSRHQIMTGALSRGRRL